MERMNVLFPGHIRPAQDNEPQLIAELYIIANCFLRRKQRVCHTLYLKKRTFLHELRQNIVGMFKCIASQGGQCFKFTNCIEPLTNVRTKLLLPSFRQKNALRAPERQHIQKPHGWISSRFEIAYNSIEAANCIRWNETIVLQSRLNLLQLCCRKLPVIDQPQNTREHIEVVRCLLDCFSRFIPSRMQAMRPRQVER